jgi:hypothetical protein
MLDEYMKVVAIDIGRAEVSRCCTRPGAIQDGGLHPAYNQDVLGDKCNSYEQ